MTVLDTPPFQGGNIAPYGHDVVQLPRPLAERVLAALRATLTGSGHLAQRVPHEHLGYCGWRTESERCVDMRELIADVEAAQRDMSRLEGQP